MREDAQLKGTGRKEVEPARTWYLVAELVVFATERAMAPRGVGRVSLKEEGTLGRSYVVSMTAAESNIPKADAGLAQY